MLVGIRADAITQRVGVGLWGSARDTLHAVDNRKIRPGVDSGDDFGSWTDHHSTS